MSEVMLGDFAPDAISMGVDKDLRLPLSKGLGPVNPSIVLGLVQDFPGFVIHLDECSLVTVDL